MANEVEQCVVGSKVKVEKVNHKFSAPKDTVSTLPQRMFSILEQVISCYDTLFPLRRTLFLKVWDTLLSSKIKSALIFTIKD